MIHIKHILALPCLICVLAAWCGAAEPVPTADEAHQQFNDAKYKDAIRTTARIVGSREWQAKKFDKFDILNLKAESHLRLKETSLAATTFDAAAKETADKPAAALARTMAYLIKHCSGTHYVPKATANKRIPGKSVDERINIDIVDPESRKEALTALWQDERNAAELKFKLAGGESVQAVLDAAPLIVRLHDFDIAAHGDDKDTSQVAGLLAVHARDLLTAMVDKMGIRVNVIHGKAMKSEQFKMQVPNGRGYGSQDVWRRHGMENNEPVEVKDILSKTEKIPVAVKMLIEDLTVEADYFDHIVKEAKRAHEMADKTLTENYGETFYSRPRD